MLEDNILSHSPLTVGARCGFAIDIGKRTLNKTQNKHIRNDLSRFRRADIVVLPQNRIEYLGRHKKLGIT